MEVSVSVDPNAEHVRKARTIWKAFTREQCNVQSYLLSAYCVLCSIHSTTREVAKKNAREITCDNVLFQKISRLGQIWVRRVF